MNIIYEDAHIIVCEKPAGVPSQSDKSADYDMVSRLKNYVYEKENKENPYIAVIHRLDRPVGGVMVFAKTPLAAKELSLQLQEKKMKKQYLAVVMKDLTELIGKEPILLEDFLVKDGKTNLSRRTDQKNKMAKKASLYYEVLATNLNEEKQDELSLVRIQLLTGRHHQIRVQLEHEMGGIWGDTKYNKLFQNKKGWIKIGLYAYSLTFLHPKTKKELSFQWVPVEEPFDRFQKELERL